ncbi:hypothetical protein ALC53_08509 [Atta colombica]|uniref:Uncharacterized protein n=1 Tax=Atta colombica TaxID=520822 RepID=A0A195B9F8_9HYME|nr:hypothetical protein ALC53_08509 [Atta colombica]
MRNSHPRGCGARARESGRKRNIKAGGGVEDRRDAQQVLEILRLSLHLTLATRGPVSPLKSQSMDDPGLEETGKRESRGERRMVKEKESERRGEDCEMRGERKEKRDIREGAKALVGGRKMKWGLLWFRRWPVVTSSSTRIDCSTRRGERSSDRE